MLLVVDVGNTNVVFGLYDGDKIREYFRMSTQNVSSADELGVFLVTVFDHANIKHKDIKDAIISSVVPNIMYSLVHGIKKYFGIDAKVVNADMKMALDLSNMENPYELGADRIVNCVGAYEIYKQPVMIIDYGTATTYDVVGRNGEFVAGITAPGIKICAEALFSKTALLGKVELKIPPSIIATNTIESIQAGILYGHIGQTEYMVNKLKTSLGEEFRDMKVVATGGLSKVIAEGTEVFDEVNTNLTLYGIKVLYDSNY